MVIAKYERELRQLGLDSLEAIKKYQPTTNLIKNQHGHRDIMHFETPGPDGSELKLFLKRVWITPRKNGISSLWRRGQVWSVSREEWDNCEALQAAGVRTAELVAWGEQCGRFWEHFSFILTKAAEGSQTLLEFLQSTRDPVRRRAVMESLGREIRVMHDAGLFSPDLFTRHVYIDFSDAMPKFCLIDMARLDREKPTDRMRRRDLAALNVTAPLRLVSPRERLRFLRAYGGKEANRLISPIRWRVRYLLRRRKYRTFLK